MTDSLMRNLIKAKGFALCGSFLAFIIAVVALRSMTASVSGDLEGLSGLSITPSADLKVVAGGSIRLTAEGDYGTRNMPIRADWFLEKGEDLGELGACSNTKSCTFTAGDSEGTATVQAQIGDGKFIDKVDIIIEQKEEELVNPFKDEPPGWALEAILRMHQKGIVKGYDDGRYGPGDPVTNAQVITLIYRILSHANLIQDPEGCAQVYDDVPQGHYAFIPACTFRRQGWSSVAERLYPDEASSRGATAGFMNGTLGETLLGAMGSRPPQMQAFDDVPLGHPHFNDIAVTNHTGLMTGYPSGDFGVDDGLNRAAVAVIMFRILNKIEEGGITVLSGYDAGAKDAHSAAPVSEASSSEASAVSEESSSSAISSEDGKEDQTEADNNKELPRGACILATKTRPRIDDPDVGFDYVKKHFSGITGVNQTACDQAVYEQLLKVYCSLEGAAGRAEPNFITFREDNGDWASMGCGLGSCKYKRDNGTYVTGCCPLECPDNVQKELVSSEESSVVSSQVSSVAVSSTPVASSVPNSASSVASQESLPRNGACAILSLPQGKIPRADDPDEGSDYAKRHVSGVNDITKLRESCNENVFQELLERFCGSDGANDRGVPRAVSYSDNGMYSTMACGGRICKYQSGYGTTFVEGCCPLECPGNEDDVGVNKVEGTITLAKPQMGYSWTYFDFSNGKQQSANANLDYDLSFYTSAQKLSISTPNWFNSNARHTLVAKANRFYDDVTLTECMGLTYNPKASGAPAFSNANEAVCFKTVDGAVGKVSNLSPSDYTVRYALWRP